MGDAENFRITPPEGLRPPGQPGDFVTEAASRRVWLWLTLGTLFVLALAVVFALPSMLQPATPQIEVAEPAPARADSTALRDQAQQTLQEFLKLRARMELGNAPAWAGPGWNESAALASKGDRYFAQRQFAAAARDYTAALELLKELHAGRAAKLQEALDKGGQALAADDVVGAVTAYQAALLIEPEQPDAVAGIAAAQRRGAAIEHMNPGRADEANDDLETARGAYQQAVQADPDYVPAQTALQRVDEEINTRKFTAAMSEALNALEAGRTAAAGIALAEAAVLRPGDPAVRDARVRLEGMRASAGLSRLRREADASVAKEDWKGAAAAYRKALKIDSAAAFARTGLRRAEEHMELHRQFDHYLAKPGRLYSAKPLANAQKLLSSVPSAPAAEPRLAGKIARLQGLVEGASTPLRVVLHSDGETNVVIYRVGRLGKFDNHQLELRPGDYTVVGSRPGYRDVRRVIRVRPGAPPPPLSVRCEESI